MGQVYWYDIAQLHKSGVFLTISLATDALNNLSDRLVGPFNLETVILPLDINISDAIMNFQDSGFQVTQKAFDTCGTPRVLRKREAIIDDQHHSKLQGAYVTTIGATVKNGKTDFEKLVNDMKKGVS